MNMQMRFVAVAGIAYLGNGVTCIYPVASGNPDAAGAEMSEQYFSIAAAQYHMIACHVGPVCVGYLHVWQAVDGSNDFAGTGCMHCGTVDEVCRRVCWLEAGCAHSELVDLHDVDPIGLSPVGAKARDAGVECCQVGIDAGVVAPVDDQVGATAEGKYQVYQVGRWCPA